MPRDATDHPTTERLDVRDPHLSASRTRRRRVTRGVLLALLVLALAACGEAPQTVLDPQGPFAQQPDNLFRFVILIALGVFLIVQSLIIYAVVKYRDKGDDSPLPTQVHGNTRMELVWTIVPALILAGIAVPTIQTVFDLAETPEGAMEVEVIGHRWWWEYRYAGMGADGGDIITANELVIPVDTPIHAEHDGPGGRGLPTTPSSTRSGSRRWPASRTSCPGRTTDPQHAGRRDRRLPGPVHRVLRPEPRQHAQLQHRADPGGVRRVGQPAAAAGARARRGLAWRRAAPSCSPRATTSRASTAARPASAATPSTGVRTPAPTSAPTSPT